MKRSKLEDKRRIETLLVYTLVLVSDIVRHSLQPNFTADLILTTTMVSNILREQGKNSCLSSSVALVSEGCSDPSVAPIVPGVSSEAWLSRAFITSDVRAVEN